MSELLAAVNFAWESGLAVDELMHGLVALPFAAFLYYKSRSVKYFLVPVAATYLIDMDHWVDYFLYYGGSVNLTRFLSGEYFAITSRAVVPLHAWEWLGILCVVAYIKKRWDSVCVGIALGVFAHLIWDSRTVGSVVFYSILYRISHGFIIPV